MKIFISVSFNIKYLSTIIIIAFLLLSNKTLAIEGLPNALKANNDSTSIKSYETVKNQPSYTVLKAPQSSPNPLYIKTSPSGDGSGSSWDNAFDGRSLGAYLRSSSVLVNQQIYIAEGTYYPYRQGVDDPALIKTYSFNISTTVSMKGGFSNSSTGTDLSQYEPKTAHVTRLSGDNVLIGNTSDNAYRVIYLPPGGNLTLDGFYISDGYNTGAGASGDGGGMYLNQNTSTAVVSNSVFENNTANYGAGIYVYDKSTLALNNVIIRNNSLTGGEGAGIFAWGNVNMYNSTICDNTKGISTNIDGFTSLRGDITIKNSTFSNNGRCGLYLSSNNPRSLFIENSTFTNHNGASATAGGIFINTSTVTPITINNTLIVNNKINITNSSFASSDYKYSIIGTTLYGQNKTTTSTVAVVSLDVLKDNGGWGATHALLNPFSNPAVGSGNPAVLSDAIDKYDQRGVLRKNPPSIGAYDASYSNPLYVKHRLREMVAVDPGRMPSMGVIWVLTYGAVLFLPINRFM